MLFRSLFVLMLGGLLLSTSIPTAFEGRGLWFAGTYAAMQVGRTAFWLLATPRRRTAVRHNAIRILTWLSCSAVLWISGGFAEHETRMWLWIAALTIEYIAPAARFWTPGLGPSSIEAWSVEGGHMAERCAGFIIIALGEAIVVDGATFADLIWTPENVTAFISALVGSIAMWWIYFHKGAEAGSEMISKAEESGRVARIAYTYLHMPIVGGIITMMMRGVAARTTGMVFSLVTLVLGVYAFIRGVNGTDLSETHRWIRAIGAWYALGGDGLSLTMILLVVILVPVVLLAEWHVDDEGKARWSTGAFFGLALMLEGLAIYCFAATDVLLFYLMFEATLIPMYFLIAGWGGPRRGRAAMKFLLYSLAGGLVMLFAVIGVGVHGGSFLLSDLAKVDFSGAIGKELFVGFFIAFAIKAPMVPVHTWLPDTAEQATAGTSALLVGLLDKIGTFGMLRLCLGLFPAASDWATPFVLTLAIISVLWGAMMAATSSDLMRFVSYTSVSHFGFMVIGIFALTTTSITGSIFYMFNHGFSTAALFLVLGFLVRRGRTAKVDAYGGVQKVAPVLAGTFLLAGLATLSLPGTGNFISEFMALAGAWARHPIYVAVSTIGMVLAAVYVLVTYRRTMTGPVQGVSEKVSDLNGREKLVLAPLIILLLVFGFFPRPMLHAIEPAATATMTQVHATDPAPVVKEGLK